MKPRHLICLLLAASIPLFSFPLLEAQENEPPREEKGKGKGGKGKGLIGASNYLSGTGCNAFSFLTYNVDGDGSNVWPYISRSSISSNISAA